MFRKTTTMILFSLSVVACTEDTTPVDGGVPPGSDADVMVEDGGVNAKDAAQPGFAESTKANLRFKEVTRIHNDFAQALGLPANEVCLELGQYDCRTVHAVTLSGVEPYELGLFVPLPSTTVTTPIAVERLAVHGCERRVTMDTDNPSAVIFTGLTDGAIANLDDPAVTEVIDRLYKRAVLRPATESEIDHLKQLYRDIEATGVDNPARQWAIATCVAVLTSVESVFY